MFQNYFKTYMFQELIDAEEEREAATKARKAAQKILRQTDMDWESYKTLDEIYAWFDYLEGKQIS